MRTKQNVIFTGGHAATTAFATVESFIAKNPGVKIVWIGSKSAFEGMNAPTLESKLMKKLPIDYKEITMGRLQSRWTKWYLASLAKIPLGFIQSFDLILKYRPKVIVSFGGFVSVPVVIFGKIFGSKVILHEQTSVLGLAHKLSIPFSDVLALARENVVSRVNFSTKIIITGNPLRKVILEIPRKTNIKIKPVIFITGGSRGAKVINDCVAMILPELLKKYVVYHQTGNIDYPRFLDMKKNLESNARHNYIPFDITTEMQKYYKKADIVVSRSGANTVSELLSFGMPSILIPLKIARNNEQLKNAEFAASVGPAVVIKEDELDSDLLIKKIMYLVKNYNKLTKQYKKYVIDRNASKKLSELILSFLL